MLLRGHVMEKIILEAPVRSTQFTGSNKIAHRLSELTAGKVKIEDAGFDWKILGPDPHDVDMVAYVNDQVCTICESEYLL